MTISSDALMDRLNLKRQLSTWRVGAIAALMVALLALFSNGISAPGKSPIAKPHIARVSIDGVVTDDPAMQELIDELANDHHVKAVILRINSPGGSAVGGQEMFEHLRALAAKKPVVAVMRDLSASAGYMIAIAADRVFAREATLTGSIGVIIESAEFSELAQKLGITPVVIKTGALKDSLSPLTKTTPEARASMQAVIDDFFQVFVDMVADRRKLPREAVLKLADGRVFTGRQAFDAKLIDALGGENEALDWLEKEKKVSNAIEIQDVEPKKPELPLLERLAQTSIQKIFPHATSTLDGLVSIWHPSL